jgi:uncharacterized repeat protein (TIGR02543 family)
MKKFYAGIALIGMIAALLVAGCSNPTGGDDIYSISLDQTGSYVFSSATVGYGDQTAKTVSVTNTGNQPTGTLTIGTSGANAGSFTVSKTSMDSLAVEGSDSFTVVPNRGLAVGTYSATITVSGGNDISASFPVSFTVSSSVTPKYRIGLSTPGVYYFTSATAGYSAAPAAYSVTVSNTGNQATGALTIGKSGTGADSFTVSTAGIADIAVGSSDTFTVVPAEGLAEGTYTATISVSGGNGISASFRVSFRVNPVEETPVYSIGVSETSYTFPEAIAGYGTQGARTITITNTGNRAIGALTIGKSGANANAFMVSKTSLPGIAVAGTDSFTVVPAAGLAAGTYSASISVSGGNDISESFTVSFTVAAAVYSISLDQTGTYAFPDATVNYGAQNEKIITVTGAGNLATGALTIGKSGTNVGSFRVSKTSLPNIAVDGTDSFTVVPVEGLAAGPYSATITVSGGNGINESFDVSFTVKPVAIVPSYGISLSEAGPVTFTPVFAGYGTQYLAQNIRTITVTNTGNQATGALTIGKSGANSANFTVSKANLPGIAVSGSDSFTVVPVSGLAAGTYTATIAISGPNSISASFNVSFTVNPAGTPAYEIELSETGVYTFPDAPSGYTAAKTVTVANKGNRATGALTIAITGADFELSITDIDDIEIGGTDTFKVSPVPGLAVGGPYSASITVDGGNGMSETFDVSFTVVPSVYTISLDQTGTYPFPGAFTGYGALTPKTVVVRNTGNQPTGTLIIGKSGADAGNFTVSKTSLSSIAVGGSDSFTVVPAQGLTAGNYDASISVTSGAYFSINGGFDVSFTVTDPTYSIILDQTGTYAFSEVEAGYEAHSEKVITVTNLGNQATGALIIEKTGKDPGSFTVSKTSLPSIAAGGTGSFTVVPVTGLTIRGTYTAGITVRGGNGLSQSFNVGLTVNSEILNTVTFDAGDGAVSTAQAAHGATVRPPSPVKSNYTFGGWYTAPNGGGTAFTASTVVSEDIRVYAKWLSANAYLAGLSVDTGWLDQSFSSGTMSYTMTVSSTTSSIGVSAMAADLGKASLTFPDGNPVSLNPGVNTLRVRVTAEDGINVRIYTITVTRTPLSADLASLEVDVGALNPAFSPNTTTYTVLVPETAASITVSATAANDGAELDWDPSDTVSLDTDSTTITLRVSAADGTAKTYTLTVKKTAATSAVSVTISPADERIDLTRSTENDLSYEARDSLRITAPGGYESYTWRVDNYYYSDAGEIQLYSYNYGNYGTHSVLLEYVKDGIPYGCEILFRVVR